MIPADAAVDRPVPERVVVGWEPPYAASTDQHVAAVDLLASRLGRAVAGVLVPWSPPLAAALPRIVELLASRGLRAVPLIDLRHGHAWTRSALPASLEALASAGVAFESDGIRYGVVVADGAGPGEAALRDLRGALAAYGRASRVGWLRRASAFVAMPAGFDFEVDWPPFGFAPAGAQDSVRQHDYLHLLMELATRHGGDTRVVPSVLWSALREAALFECGARVGEISPLRMNYAIDAARRFVRNRLLHGAPFWVLRAALSPADRNQVHALDALAGTLAREHRPSAAVGRVAALDFHRAPTGRIAVVVHLYYPDLWGEIARAIEALPERFDLFVSCPFRVLGATRRMVHQTFSQAVVYGVQNLGRDVLPFLLWLRHVGPNAYTYVLKLHGKKSVHIVDPSSAPFGGGDVWRRSAFTGLVGSAGHAGAVLRALDAAPDVGMVAAAGQLYDQVRWRCGTTDLVGTALGRLGIDCAVEGGFPAGTMFWARTAALAPLAGVADGMLDFEREAGQVDGTLHHAYERLFALVARGLGYRLTDSATLVG